MKAAWEQTFGRMERHGRSGAGNVVVQGIHSAGPDRHDVVDQWVAIGERVNAIVEASRTTH